MNKTILSILAAIFIANAFITTISVGATDHTCGVLSEFDGFCYEASKTKEKPKIDGVLSDGEFPVKNTVSFGNGLRLVSSTGLYEADDTVYSRYEKINSLSETVSVSFDEKFIYVGVSYSESASRCLSPVSHPLFGSVYIFTVELSFNSDDNPFKRSAGLSNSYCFSSVNLSGKGCFGTRTAFSGGRYELIGRISSQSEENELCYTDESGNLWNGKSYLSAAHLSQVGGAFVFECKIPVGDVIRSTASASGEEVLRHLFSADGTLVGSFDVKAVVDPNYYFADGHSDTLCFSTSLSGSSSCASHEGGESRSQCLAAAYGVPGVLLDEIAAPVSFGPVVETPSLPSVEPTVTTVQKAPETSSESPKATENQGTEQGSFASSVTSGTAKQTTKPSAKTTVTDSAAVSSEAIDDSLWQEFLEWETAQTSMENDVADETVYNGEGESNQFASELSSFLFLGFGILLLSSVIGVGIIFRSVENKNYTKKK